MNNAVGSTYKYHTVAIKSEGKSSLRSSRPANVCCPHHHHQCTRRRQTGYVHSFNLAVSVILLHKYKSFFTPALLYAPAFVQLLMLCIHIAGNFATIAFDWAYHNSGNKKKSRWQWMRIATKEIYNKALTDWVELYYRSMRCTTRSKHFMVDCWTSEEAIWRANFAEFQNFFIHHHSHLPRKEHLSPLCPRATIASLSSHSENVYRNMWTISGIGSLKSWSTSLFLAPRPVIQEFCPSHLC